MRLHASLLHQRRECGRAVLRRDRVVVLRAAADQAGVTLVIRRRIVRLLGEQDIPDGGRLRAPVHDVALDIWAPPVSSGEAPHWSLTVSPAPVGEALNDAAGPGAAPQAATCARPAFSTGTTWLIDRNVCLPNWSWYIAVSWTRTSLIFASRVSGPSCGADFCGSLK